MTDKNDIMEEQDYPKSVYDLDCKNLPELGETNIGEEVWISVSPIRKRSFRAVKVRVLNKVSIGAYERDYAIGTWDNEYIVSLDYKYTE